MMRRSTKILKRIDWGNCTSKKLPGRAEITLLYDPANRLVAEYDIMGKPTVYGYDECGRKVLTAPRARSA